MRHQKNCGICRNQTGMKVLFRIAATIGMLGFAAPVLAHGGARAVTPPPPLSHFTTRYGFPTFPRLAHRASRYKAPVIYNGPDYTASRIGDLSKAPIVENAKPPPPPPPPPPRV